VKPVLILGIGNILLRDEGVGVHVVQELTRRAEAGEWTLPDDVELVDGGTFGLDLVDVIAGRRKVVVIDAVDADAPPASILRFDADDLAAKRTADLSLHQVGLLETLAMARQLGCAVGEVIILGVVPKDLSPGLEMTSEVAALVPSLIERVLREIAA